MRTAFHQPQEVRTASIVAAVQPVTTLSGRPLPKVGRDFFTIVRHTRWPRVSSMTTARRRTWWLPAIALSGLLIAAPAQAIGTTDGTTALHGETDGDTAADRQAVSREIERFRS